MEYYIVKEKLFDRRDGGQKWWKTSLEKFETDKKAEDWAQKEYEASGLPHKVVKVYEDDIAFCGDPSTVVTEEMQKGEPLRIARQQERNRK